MQNIGRLLDILRNADDIRRDIMESEGMNDACTRMEFICGIAITELVKEGMPHTFENGSYIIETDGRKYVYVRPGAKGANPANETVKETVSSEPAEKEYNADKAEDEPKAENGLKPETKPELKEEPLKSPAASNILEGQVSPEWFDEEDVAEDEPTDVKPSVEREEERKPEEAFAAEQEEGSELHEDIPEAGNDTNADADEAYAVPEEALKSMAVNTGEVINDLTEPLEEDVNDADEYPTFLHRDDFMFEYRRIVIRDNMDKKVCSVEFVSTPLHPGDPDSPALLWAQHGKEAFTITVEPRTRQKIEVENVPFYYMFSYIDGEFKSEVDLTNNYKQINYRIQERERQNFGGKGHIIIADDDIKVHIMPLTFYNNNSNGNAEFMYCIESGRSALCGETNGADHCEADINGLTLNLVARWEPSSNILYAQVSG